MAKTRHHRPCRTCGRKTKSVTRYCAPCRPADAIPAITRVPGGISFAGLTLTDSQALTLTDTIVDTLEGETDDHPHA